MSKVVNAVRTTISENLGGAAQKAAPSSDKFGLDDVPDQTGKVAVVTGGSEGIGYGVTHTLLSKNVAKLYILSGSKEVVDSAKDAVKEELGEEIANRTIWLQCDLSDWPRVKEVAHEIINSTDRLDILFNNAARGIMTHQLTDYGIDRHLAVGHFGHVILTSHLLPLLKKTASQGHTVRIDNQSSNLHEKAPKETSFESVEELNKDYGANAQYGRLKLANLLYARYLARHLSPENPSILVNATHPGVVSTKMSTKDIHEPFPRAGYLMSKGLEPFKKDQFEGALSALYATTTTTQTGQYVCPPATVEPGSDKAKDEQLGEQLMKITREVIKDKTGEDLQFY